MHKKIIGGSVVAVALVFLVWWTNWYFGLPTVYYYPNGECATVVEYTEDGKKIRPCGWQDGRKYHVEYVDYSTNLVELAKN